MKSRRGPQNTDDLFQIASLNREVEARLQELALAVRKQKQKAQTVFRMALRNSFPRNRWVEGTVQYVDPSTSGEAVHYFDCFGEPESEHLWIFGLKTANFSSSSSLIEVLLDLNPLRLMKDSGMSPTQFASHWMQHLKDLSLDTIASTFWVWAYIEASKNRVMVFGSPPHPLPALSVWKNGHLEPVAVSTPETPKPLTLESSQTLLFSTGWLGLKEFTPLKTLEHHLSTNGFASDTVLAHLHEQFLFLDHRDWHLGGTSVWLRLRGKALRQVAHGR
jgi:hypothetical protein